MKIISSKIINGIYKPRLNQTSKNNFGHSLLIAGNAGTMGASIIASTACLRAGTGLLTTIVPKKERMIIQVAVPEAMTKTTKEFISLELTKFSAIAIGPGIGLSERALRLLVHCFNSFNKPMIIDADALNLMSTQKTLIDFVPRGSILTPHIREFDRLFGVHANEADRIKTAKSISNKHDLIIVLKSNETKIIYKDDVHINKTGNSGLAKGGSGDALTGIITAFVSQAYEPLHACILGVYLHGAAADETLKTQSTESMMISDVLHNLGKCFNKIKT